MDLKIPKKNSKNGKELYNHQVRLDSHKTERFTRVREILGGYSSSELIEILVDRAISAYDDGKEVENKKMLPKNFMEGN